MKIFRTHGLQDLIVAILYILSKSQTVLSITDYQSENVCRYRSAQKSTPPLTTGRGPGSESDYTAFQCKHKIKRQISTHAIDSGDFDLQRYPTPRRTSTKLSTTYGPSQRCFASGLCRVYSVHASRSTRSLCHTALVNNATYRLKSHCCYAIVSRTGKCEVSKSCE